MMAQVYTTTAGACEEDEGENDDAESDESYTAEGDAVAELPR